MCSVTLYSKPNCPLCDEALEQIEEARRSAPFDFVEIDILRDPALYDRFRNLIPVVFLNGREAFRYRLVAGDLAALVRACS